MHVEMVDTAIIIQARMGSSRVPGKVLMPIQGKPLLQYLLDRIKFANLGLPILIATSSEHADQPIIDFCAKQTVDCYKGSHLDVASRFNDIIHAHGLSAFVRICGDSPLLDGRIIKQALETMDDTIDLVTNVCPRSYPKGQSVEIIRTSTFKKTYQKMSTPDQFEHVTKYYYDHQDEFQINNFQNEKDLSSYRLVMDRPEDLIRLKKIIGSMTKPHTEYTLNELIDLYPLSEKTSC